MFFDPVYLLFMAPALLLSLWASWMTSSRFKRYSRVASSSGLTGAQAAQMLLDRAGVRGVSIGRSSGRGLSDHYNPLTKTLALSPQVYGSTSVAAIGVATHEAGHAIQHARNYAPMWLRSALVPTANIGSSVGYLMMMLGLFISTKLVAFGALLFSAVLLFQIVTLPVEFNASSRAKRLVLEHGIVSRHESAGVSKVLNAAAMTYVAAAISTLMTLLFFLMRAGLLGGGDD